MGGILLVVAVLHLIISASWSFCLQSRSKSHWQTQSSQYLQVSNSGDDIDVSNDPELKEYLNGSSGKVWKGSREMLGRRKQIPASEYTIQDVVKKCLAALQNNDEPQLDHGACVTLEFKNPSGPLAEGDLDPAAYGRFLRSTEYNVLLDFKKAEIIGEPEQLNDSLSYKQRVKVTGWQNDITKKSDSLFDFYLTKVSDKWLLDVILICKN